MITLKFIITFSLIFLYLNSYTQEIQVIIKGYDDGIKTNKQQDFKEAVTNAKLEAIERAGSEISSITKIANFEMKSKEVELKAEAVLLPGYDVMDIGYQTDGTYLVVLSGKIKSKEDSKNYCTLTLVATKTSFYDKYKVVKLEEIKPQFIEALSALKWKINGEDLQLFENDIIEVYKSKFYPTKFSSNPPEDRDYGVSFAAFVFKVPTGVFEQLDAGKVYKTKLVSGKTYITPFKNWGLHKAVEYQKTHSQYLSGGDYSGFSLTFPNDYHIIYSK